VNLEVRGGEIVGIAGVSGNGQRELVEALAGQRMPASGEITMHGEAYRARREDMRRHKIRCVPEEPLRNASVPAMSVSDNLAFRNFDRPPFAKGILIKRRAMRATARELIQRFSVRPPEPGLPIGSLSGGNVQRAVLARELSDEVDVLVVANPCFGLDFGAVADIHAQIMAARNRGAAVLLVSEDLDEILELSDRLLVISAGRLVHETTPALASLNEIGQHMAGH
jgi:simple sugar transport system ATP-binding protein